MFLWYLNNGDGSAEVLPDTPANRARVDRDPSRVYGTPEGPILHGGVLATAFKRETHALYDAAHWLQTGELLLTGEMSSLVITAEPRKELTTCAF